MLQESCGRSFDLSRPCSVLCAVAGPQDVSASSERLQAGVWQ